MIKRASKGEMLTTPQIARMLSLTATTVGRYCAKGILKAFKVNTVAKKSTWRVPPEEIEKLTGMKVMWDENDLPHLVSIQ